MIKSVSIGIDPGGTTGAVCAITESVNGVKTLFYKSFAKSSPREMSDFIKQFSVIAIKKAVLEKVHAMPGQGVTSVFSFGNNYGFIQGLLVAHGFPFVEVSPLSWQKKFKSTSGVERFNSKDYPGATPSQIEEIKKSIKVKNQQRKKEHKDQLYAIAQNLYPNGKFNKQVADAVLICEYCRKFEL